jgi:tetratricopeptide (TPR) repeat protein
MKTGSGKGLRYKHHRKQDHEPVKQVKENRYVDWLGLAIIILLGIIIYSNSFKCSFHFDDLLRIVDNTNIQNLSDVKAWSGIYPSRPAGMFTFALNYHFNQLDVWYYHLVNLIIHLINACLIWWLTLLIFSSPVMKDQSISGNKKVIAFFTALLFVSHPLATQSVTYIIQRMASMAAMFYLLSLALYVKARLANKRDVFSYLLFAGSLVSCLLAVLTKENAYTLPFAILLFEIIFLRTKKISINFKDYRVVLLSAALLGIIIIIPLTFSSGIFKPILPTPGHPYTITPVNYLFTQFSVILKYIQLLILPINQKLDYDFPVSNTFFEISTLLSFLVLLSLFILAILSLKKYRIISLGIFWFFLTLSVESGFIPINDVINEHRTYLPSFGFFLILTSGIYFLLWNSHKYVAIAIFVILIGSNSWLTYERNKIWKDDLTLWSDNIAKTPELPRPFVSRGVAYGNLGQWDKAIGDFSSAIKIDHQNTDAYSNRGVAYATLGQFENAIADFSSVIQIDPKKASAYSNRGLAYGNLGQWDKAINDCSKAIGIDPNYSTAYFNRGIVYLNLGQWDKAIADNSKATEISPGYTDAWCNLGVAYAKYGQYDKAIAEFSKAIEIDPKFTKAYADREITYRKMLNEKQK